MGGRPRLSPDEKRSVGVRVVFKPAEYDALCSEAFRQFGRRVAVSGYFRALLLRAHELGVLLLTKPRGASK